MKAQGKMQAPEISRTGNLAVLLAAVILFVSIQAVFCQPSSKQSAPFKYAFIDKSGKVAFNVELDKWGAFGKFSEGLCYFIERNQKNQAFCGYIDRSGKRVIQAKFSEARDFHEGRAVVRVAGANGEKGKYGYIDRSGRLVIPAKFEHADDFSEGLALVQQEKKSKCGFINADGNFVIAPQFAWARRFCQGLAGCERGYIDKTGKLKIVSNQGGRFDFSCGLAQREVLSLSHRYYHVKKDGTVYANNRNWGYIDRTGRFIILPAFVKCWGFSNDRALVQVPVSLAEDPPQRALHNFYAFIDNNGEIISVINSSDEPHKFSEGLAAVHAKGEDGHYAWGYMDMNGKLAIPPEFKDAGDFSEGLAAVEGGYIDRQGKMAISVDSVAHADFSEGLAAVTFLNK